MAPIPTPTVQNQGEKRPPRPITGSSSDSRRSELCTRVKFSNTLPDLPFDPKFIAYPFGSNRFVTYSTTSLERNYVYEVLTEPDLGVDVELVIPNAYSAPPNASLHLDCKDERLLEDDNLMQKNQKRSRHHAKSVSWLRRTEYISTEQTRFQPQTIEKVEAKVGYSIKKSLKEEMHYMDRESQIENIKKTFEDAMKPIDSHFAKPGVVPVEVLPVFPDFNLWKYPCAQVIFDSDPAPIGRSVPGQLEEMSQAMIRGVMDDSGEQFVAYFLPSEETLNKRKRDQDIDQEYQEEDTYEYRMAREYNWNVKSKATKGYEENYFFVIRDNGVFYNELETRVRLSKRRTRGPHQQLNTKLCVKHIPLTASDYKFQRKREKELEPIQEDEEEEEEVEEHKSEKSDNEKSDAEVEPDKDADDELKSIHEEKRAKGSSSGGSDSEKSDKGGVRKAEAKTSKRIVSDDSDKEGSSGSEHGSPKGSPKIARKAKSRSRSKSKSKSRSRSRSRSRTPTRSSRSRSNSRSGSGSGSGTGSGSSGSSSSSGDDSD